MIVAPWAPAARALDFEVTAAGPHLGFAGYVTSLVVYGRITQEDPAERSLTRYSVDGLPEAATARWTYNEKGTAWGVTNPYEVHLAIPRSADGTYMLTLGVENSGIKRTMEYPLTIVHLERESRYVPASALPIAEFESRMVKFGEQHCDEAQIARLGVWDQGLVHYDGVRTYYQIADYTGDDKWLRCAAWVKAAYAKHIEETNGFMQGWRYFPKGLYMDHQRTADEHSADLIRLMAETRIAWGSRTGGSADTQKSRYVAYTFSVFHYARKLGGLSDTAKADDFHQRLAENALAHLIQWSDPSSQMAGPTGPEPHGYQPFMGGLTMEALTEYYAETRDPRVPVVIRAFLDELWTRWDSEAKAFPLRTYEDKCCAPGLNQLISPAYAWYYAQSGDESYREKADAIFTGGMAGWLGRGKHFNQNHRWVFDYLRWRE